MLFPSGKNSERAGRKSGPFCIYRILLACALLALSAHSLWASALSEIQANLPNGGTILTAKPADLAGAVVAAILSNTDPSITPANLAAAAFDPVAGRVRADRNTVAPLVTATIIHAFVSATDAHFNADVAAVTDALLDVNEYAPGETLSTAGQSAVVKAALAAVSDSAVTNAAPALLSADQALGAALAADSYLEGLPHTALTTILQNAIAGVSGAAGKSQTVAPAAAQAFVAGVVSSQVPNGAPISAFAVAILKNVSKNTSLDALVAYQVALKDNASQYERLTLAAMLFSKYPAAAVQITQGIAGVVPEAAGEPQRIAFIQALTNFQVNAAVSIAQGAVFLDPYHAADFTQAVFNSILISGGAKRLATDAPRIASGLGATLGLDGDNLTQVANVISQFIADGKLPVAGAVACAADLIRGAVNSKVPASQLTGGRLNLGAGLTAATVADISSIVDLFTNAILTADRSTSTLPKAAPKVAALAKAVARFFKNELFVDSEGVSQPVAAYLAGTVANQVVQLIAPGPVRSDLLAAISKAVSAVTNRQVASQVVTAIANNNNYPVMGAITVPESTVTNL